MGLERIDLMQFHWWMFQHPAYIDALEQLVRLRQEGVIGEVGVTNFDTDHLRLIVKHGYRSSPTRSRSHCSTGAPRVP